MKSVILTVVLAALLPQDALATSIPPVDLDELIGQADFIVVAKVVETSIPDGKGIAEVSIVQTLKGDTLVKRITVFPVRTGYGALLKDETALLFLVSQPKHPDPSAQSKSEEASGGSRVMQVMHFGTAKIPLLQTEHGETLLDLLRLSESSSIEFPKSLAIQSPLRQERTGMVISNHMPLRPILEYVARKLVEGLPPALALKRSVNWGYGCGGHCAFRYSGESSVALHVKDGVATLNDVGTHKVSANYPNGHSEDSRTWKLNFKGSNAIERGKSTLSLNAQATLCEHEVTGGEGRSKVDCSGKAREIVVGCGREQVFAIRGSPRRNAERRATNAWVCRLKDSKPDYPGTEFPWVFGIDREVLTLYFGEPHPEIYYVIADDPR
ncbi:MAG: hypothetical protein HY897_20270 [Deltaproteobacteria bacterium]|nr:hypothetical protein [Deltaproteobacteria bacterium]